MEVEYIKADSRNLPEVGVNMLLPYCYGCTEAQQHRSIYEYVHSIESQSLKTAYSYENDEDTDDPYGMSTSSSMRALTEREIEKLVLINRTRPTPCDKEMTLYQLEYNNLDEKLNKPLSQCARPFYAQHVNYTNMLMIVIDGHCPIDDTVSMSIDASEVQYNESLPCLKHMHPLYRKQPTSCIRNHTEESNIDMCGRGSLIDCNNGKKWFSLSILLIIRYWQM